MTGIVSSLLRRQSTLGKPKPKLRALIIGIAYKNAANPKEIPRLKLPHRDAKDWQRFLIEKHGYHEEDTILMLDEPEHPLQPTREEILHQIDEFVKDAQAGDHLMFYYSGHSTQHPCRHMTEDDGKDEAIMPCDTDGRECCNILDNELRKRMVDPLPAGVCLTAVFDACHSGTLLDLDHYNCNDCRLGWGKKFMRKLSLPLQCIGLYGQSGYAESVRTPERAESLPKLDGMLRVHERKRKSDGSLFSRDTVLRPPAAPGEPPQPILRRSTSESKHRVSFDTKLKKPSRHGTVDSSKTTRRDGQSICRFLTDRPMCSPPEDSTRCNGACRSSPSNGAVVISLSAARDPETAWEGKRRTMTQLLIQALNELDLHPTFHDLVHRLGQLTFKHITHPLRRGFLRRVKYWETGQVSDNGQLLVAEQPMDVGMGSKLQLGSLYPLSGGERFGRVTPSSSPFLLWNR